MCSGRGCVATARRMSGDVSLISTFVFDDVGGRWLAVAVTQGNCGNADVEVWEVFSLQPRPDGALSGEFSYSLPGRRMRWQAHSDVHADRRRASRFFRRPGRPADAGGFPSGSAARPLPLHKDIQYWRCGAGVRPCCSDGLPSQRRPLYEFFSRQWDHPFDVCQREMNPDHGIRRCVSARWHVTCDDHCGVSVAAAAAGSDRDADRAWTSG